MAIALLPSMSHGQQSAFFFSGSTAKENVANISSYIPPKDMEFEFSGTVNPLLLYSTSSEVLQVSGNTLRIVSAPECRIVPVEDTMASLRGLVTLIQGGTLLGSGSADFEELLTKAAGLRGTPSDIEAWANQLAESVGDFTD